LEGRDRRLFLRNNNLQLKKPQKIEKRQKNTQNNFRRTPVFLQKRVDFEAGDL
jgi:hypothetical protein